MYAHVTTGHIDPDQLEKYLDTLRTSSIPDTKAQPGYEGSLFLADPQSGQFIGIVLFQTEGHRQAIEESGFGEARRSLSSSLHNVTMNKSEFYQVCIVDGKIRAVESPA